jgi:hypothetical protein
VIAFLKSLLSPELWRALWIALRRSLRDRRARRDALRLVLVLVLGGTIVLAYFAWYLYHFRFINEDQEARQVIGVGLIAVIVLVGAGAAVRQLWEWRKEVLWERHKQNCSDGEVALQLKLDVYGEACLLAALLERLSSEVAMEKELPEGFTVTTRRVLLDRLADLKLRQTLEPWLLDILLAPDGHWPGYLKTGAMPAWECLAVLRWALGIAELRDLTVDPKYDWTDASGLFEVKEPKNLNLVRPWKIRFKLEATEVFFSRCWSEIVARGEVADLPQEDVEKASREREAIRSEGYTADFLIGASTISELPSPLLWFIARRAYNRCSTLSLMVPITTGDLPPNKLRELFARFFEMNGSREEEIVPEARAIAHK